MDYPLPFHRRQQNRLSEKAGKLPKAMESRPEPGLLEVGISKAPFVVPLL